MLINPSLLIILWLSIPSRSEPQSALAVKKGISNYSIPIAVGVESYKELVRKSKMFVDHSLLIKDLIYYMKRPWFLAGPRKFGKTVTLDMIKMFFEIKVDPYGDILPKEHSPAYKLFVEGIVITEDGEEEKLEKPLLISKFPEQIERQLGQVPVIYLNFKHIQGESYVEIERQLNLTIRKAYEDHKYMHHIIKNPLYNNTVDEVDLEDFESMLGLREKPLIPLKRSIQHLAKTLHLHFQRRPIILFDDFDAPVVNALQGNVFSGDLNAILKTMEELYNGTFKDNFYYWMGITAGVFQLQQITPRRIYDDFELVDIVTRVDNGTIYFGIHEKIMQEIISRLSISEEEHQQIRRWFDGYISRYENDHYFNPHSIANYLAYHQFTSYWKAEEYQTLIEVFVPKKVRPLLLLLSNPTTAYAYTTKIGRDHAFQVEHLNASLKGGFAWYLYRLGFLSTRDIPTHKHIEVKIANFERALDIATWLINYFCNTFQINATKLTQAATDLIDFIDNNSSSITKFQKSLNDLYAASSYTEKPQAPEYALFNAIGLKLQCLSQFKIDVVYLELLVGDIVMINNYTGNALIMEVRYLQNKTVHDALKGAQLLRHVLTGSGYNINTMKFLGIKVFVQEKTTEIATNETTINEMYRLKQNVHPKFLNNKF